MTRKKGKFIIFQVFLLILNYLAESLYGYRKE